MTESAPADSGGNNGRTGRGRGRGGRGRGRGKGGKGRGGRGRGRGRGRGGADQAADAELPYGGDIQAAMRAQDRDAIRALMAAQADRKPEAPRASPKTKKKPPKKKAGKKRPDFWWRESVDVDPISLEPLSDLELAAVAILTKRAEKAALAQALGVEPQALRNSATGSAWWELLWVREKVLHERPDVLETLLQCLLSVCPPPCGGS